MDQHAAVSRFPGKTVFHVQAVVVKFCVRDQVSQGASQADQIAVANDKGFFQILFGVCLRDVSMPSSQILAIEKFPGFPAFLMLGFR